jgi:hypothetical protein
LPPDDWWRLVSDNKPSPSDASAGVLIEKARAAIFNGLVNKTTLAAALKRSTRTVERLKRRGMPFVQFGGEDLFHPPRINQWILENGKTLAARKRGRPPVERR